MHFSTGISAFAYKNLRDYLDLPSDTIEMVDPVQCLARVDDDVLQRFHCDCILLRPRFSGNNIWTPRASYTFSIPESMHPQQDERGQWIVSNQNGRMRMPKGGYFFDGDWLSFYDKTPDSQDFQETVKEAERIFKETGYYTIYIGFGAYFNGSVDALCEMLTDPEDVMAKNELALAGNIARAKAVIKHMGKYIQGIALNSDLGTQQGPLCNPEVHKELCAPYLKRFCNFIHENSDFQIFHHTCGSIQPFIPTLIDCGVDVLNPVQISAANMDPQTLKDRFGKDIAFWGGGCNTQAVLNMGSPEDVKKNVKELVGVFKKNSGFVFNQVHNILGDIAPENIVAMLDTAYTEAWPEIET
jgi:uroporphyrinogen decarboxylase